MTFHGRGGEAAGQICLLDTLLPPFGAHAFVKDDLVTCVINHRRFANSAPTAPDGNCQTRPVLRRLPSLDLHDARPCIIPKPRLELRSLMRCNLCDGSGMRRASSGLLPCPECGGCGVAHCCDGLVACGDIEGDLRFERATARDAGSRNATRARRSTTGKRHENEAPGFKP